MKSSDTARPATITARPDSFHRWRGRKDLLAKRVIGLGGVMVIAAVLLILFYLLYVVMPLFLPAHASQSNLGGNPGWTGDKTVFLSLEEQQQVAFRVSQDGVAEFFKLDGLSVIEKILLSDDDRKVAHVAGDQGNSGLIAVAFDDGLVSLVKETYTTDYSAGIEQRTIKPVLEFPYGAGQRILLPTGAMTGLVLSENDSQLLLAAAGIGGQIRIELNTKQENFLSGEITLERSVKTFAADFEVTTISVSSDHRWLYLGDSTGRVHFISIASMETIQVVQVSDAPITSTSMLLGGISLLAGDARGTITQLFPVRDADNQFALEKIRRFESDQGAIVRIIPEQRRKGFVAVDAQGGLAIYHSTAGTLVLQRQLDNGLPDALALAPRASGLLILNTDGSADFMDIDNEHPEVSFASLWSKVWYENYEAPEYVWQSSASSNDFEPKFSLTPLAFGTLKAALYAMLFALPLALMGAAFTAYFMSPALRRLVKPTIEIMEALPTVILGFLAGLWFAPFLEENLAGVLSMLIVMPIGLLLFAWFWTRSQWRIKSFVKPGWEPILLLPVIVVLAVVSMEFAGPLQSLFFGGDLRSWLSQEAGISYDQRNAMVVGCAMGFAVIPTIFSIAEDAIYGVPKSLSDGSLALGATSWQTLVRVILPTASPGMFSAVMIGLGRAVGETMIVLMATGNTPIMDWNLFEGMRTLAANIAVEMPESALNSSHYRILFLAALVLFVFTFFVNTGAELVRQRLREKYSSL
ncbi:MAG: ABC transporter permease subunit [Xanthomonadales bacterium]|nr:ABC transporter permease subunit [Xanthomonadales bacterium]